VQSGDHTATTFKAINGEGVAPCNPTKLHCSAALSALLQQTPAWKMLCGMNDMTPAAATTQNNESINAASPLHAAAAVSAASRGPKKQHAQEARPAQVLQTLMQGLGANSSGLRK
jgi:hypothetical protein